MSREKKAGGGEGKRDGAGGAEGKQSEWILTYNFCSQNYLQKLVINIEYIRHLCPQETHDIVKRANLFFPSAFQNCKHYRHMGL